jgi:hypothetical protein
MGQAWSKDRPWIPACAGMTPGQTEMIISVGTTVGRRWDDGGTTEWNGLTRLWNVITAQAGIHAFTHVVSAAHCPTGQLSQK